METNRRSFIKGSVASALFAGPVAQAAGLNEKKLVVGLIGFGGRGEHLLRCLDAIRNVEVATICDPDSKHRKEAIARADGVKTVGDFRRILDDQSIDAVVIATPDHWHAPAGLMAIDAGKHVYVEKPYAHNLREAVLLRDAANKSDVVVQHGIQVRSALAFKQVMQQLREGIIGDVLSAKAWNIQRRKDIGHCNPSDPPAGFDYAMWIGPAEMVPFQSNRHHYSWHWWHDFGCGGIGNDGIHHLDYARWGLGPEMLPNRVSAMGGKYFFDDDQQFPDTQQIAFEYDDGAKKRLLVYEQRLWSVTYPYNVDAGVEYYGTEGEMFVSSRGKIRIVGRKNQRIEWKPEGPLKHDPVDHVQNWVDCIRGDATQNGTMDDAYHTVALVHLGNIASRLGGMLELDPQTGAIVGNREANELVTRRYRKGGHWAIPAGV